jgi:hypothetical protein
VSIWLTQEADKRHTRALLNDLNKFELPSEELTVTRNCCDLSHEAALSKTAAKEAR